ncbi:MAG: hypothetical protein M3463_19200 [Verrucomicrobiota bacterium]|nr:hypothetical protein [Verrucomicrobiota bacterium]
MPLRLNLNHEIEQLKLNQKRDPLKLALRGLALLVAGFAGYYFLLVSQLGTLKQEYQKKEAAFKALAPDAKKAKAREQELALLMQARDRLVYRMEHRFYWAAMLQQLIQSVPSHAQITKLSGDLQGSGVKKCTLTIDGLSAGVDPRQVAEEMRTAIAENFSKQYKAVSSSFRSLEDGVQLVQLDGKPLPTTTFAINVQLTSRDEAPPPPASTPAPAREPKKR